MRRLITLALAFTLARSAAASRPFIDWYGLREVAQQGGSVYLGHGETTSRGEQVFFVERVFGRLPSENPVVYHLAQPPVQRHVLESPRGALLRDRLTVMPSGPVLLVRYGGDELMAATDENLRKLELLFDKRPYTPRVSDLNDPDLAWLARDALAKAGKLQAVDLARAHPPLLAEHFAALDVAGKRGLLRALLSPAEHDAEIRKGILPLAIGAHEESLLPEIAKLAASARQDGYLFDQFWSDVNVWLNVVESEHSKPPNFSPLTDVFADTCFASTSSLYLDRFLPVIDAPAKARLTERLLARLSTEKLDDRSYQRLEKVTELVELAPAAAQLEPLAKVVLRKDPVYISSESEFTFVLRMTIAIVRAHPATKARAKAIVAPLFTAGLSGQWQVVSAWESLAGPAPQKQ